MQETNKIEIPTLLTEEGKKTFRKREQIIRNSSIVFCIIGVFIVLVITTL